MHQFRMHLEAVERRERQLYLQQITAARLAQHDGKSFKAAMKELGYD